VPWVVARPARTTHLRRVPRPEPAGGPADRVLIATAIGLACPLITYNRIVRLGETVGRQFGFATGAQRRPESR
jgi:hypothetical protein